MNTGRALNLYGFVVLSAGIVSVLLSTFRLVSWLHLPFSFGYMAGQVNLTIVSETYDTLIWIIAVLTFAVYPVVTKQRTFVLLLVHGAIPFCVLLLLVSPETFPVLALNNIFAFAIAVARSRRKFNISSIQAVALVSSVVCLVMIAVEVLATFSILSDPAALLDLYRTGSPGLLSAGRLSLGLFYLGDGGVGILLILLMFSPILVIVASRTSRGSEVGLGLPDGGYFRHARFDGFVVFLLVGVAALAAFIAVLPYLLHPVPMGVDALWYLGKSAGETSPLGLAREEPRAAYVLLLFFLRTAFQLTPVGALASGAALLAVLSVMGTFFFTWEVVHRMDVTLLAAFLAGVSPQVLVGTFAGIFEAWLVYSECLIFFGVFLHATRNSNWKFAAGAVLLSVLIMLTHVWTWLVLMLILSGQVIVLVIQPYSRHTIHFTRGMSLQVWVLLMSTVIGAIILTLGTALFPSLAALNLTLPLFSLGLRSPMFFYSELSLALTYYVGGFFSNWILISLAIVGLFASWYLASEVRVLIAAWLLVPASLSTFLAAALQWRLLFLFPYSFLAALGICFTLGKLRARMVGSRDFADAVLFYMLEYAGVVAIALMFWNNALRSMVFVSASF